MKNSLYNLNIERSILSLIIFDPSTFEEVISILKAEDFYLPFHQHLFRAMESLNRAEKPIDEEFLKEELLKEDKFDEVAMVKVLSANPITNSKAYIYFAKELSTKRSLISLAGKIREITLEDDLEVNEIMNLIEKKLYQITQDSIVEDFKNSKDIAISVLKGIKELKEKNNDGLIGVDTGFKNLNLKTNGFGKGDLIIIAARPSMGKTALALNISLKAIDRDEGVVFFSLEMPAEQLMLRMMSIKTSIPLQKLRIGDLNDNEWSRLSYALDDISSKKLFVDDGGYATIHHIRSKLRKLKSQHSNISMAVIDYLQLMSGNRGKEGRQQEISEISRGLKQLARELEIPILALSQLNRGLESRENKRPMLSDLRESGCLAGDTLIVDSKTGKEYKIEDIVKNKRAILPLTTDSMDKNLEIKSFDVTNSFYSGKKSTYKLKTESGKLIRATANHKFYRVDGWKRLDNLKVGDKIAVSNSKNLNWEEIVSIEKHKIEKTYDLTVNSVHNFVANGIVVHNSIEQDADIVMFVYRDDVYREIKEREKESKAKAEGRKYEKSFESKPEEKTEIIIGKQRNGPIGTVSLIFHKKYTRFVDGDEVLYEHKSSQVSNDKDYYMFTNLENE